MTDIEMLKFDISDVESQITRSDAKAAALFSAYALLGLIASTASINKWVRLAMFVFVALGAVFAALAIMPRMTGSSRSVTSEQVARELQGRLESGGNTRYLVDQLARRRNVLWRKGRYVRSAIWSLLAGFVAPIALLLV